jgi:nucleoside-diphosphate-sugar epimerase
VCVSSLAATGPAADGRPRIATDPPGPVSHYGRSKRAGEQAAAAFADRVPITIIRPPMVFGEGDRASLPLYTMIARWGIHLVPGRGRNRVSLVHAADLAELMILAAQRGTRIKPPGAADARPGRGYYFAACPEAPAYADLGQMIGAAVGRSRVKLLRVATPLVWMVAAAGSALARIRRRPAYMNLDRVREVMAGSWLCSPQAAIEELGFSVKASLADRLRQTAAWYRQEGWL